MSSLELDRKRFVKRTEALRFHFGNALVGARTGEFSPSSTAKFCVVSLVDCWADFHRSVILSSAVGGVRTSSGTVLPLGPIRSKSDALLAAKTSLRGKVGNEPRWHDADQSIATAKKLNIANFNDYSLAVGDANSPADQIRLVRNFFCHERSDCAEKLRSAKWFSKSMDLSPVGVSGLSRSDGRLNFDYWIDELQLISSLCVI